MAKKAPARKAAPKKKAAAKPRVTKKKSPKKAAKKKPNKKSAAPPPIAPDDGAYERHRERAAGRARMQSAGRREIGAIPPVAEPERRRECEQNLQLALETYYPDVFGLGWSDQHLEVIDALNQTLRFGGLFAFAMPRGSGKTSLSIHAGQLAMLYGWRSFLVLLGAAAEPAYEMLDIFKVQLETNDLLLEDFPEVCYSIRELEGISQRALGQTSGGAKTAMQWSGRKKIVLPTTYHRGKPRGGGVVQALGLLGRVRGLLHQTISGKTIRPDAFLGDDLQTDQSAKKVEQVERRETVLNGAVRGLAGPGKRIAGLCTVTIVRKGDLADRLTDRKLNPHYQGRVFSLVERWPEHSQLWDKYAELREVDLLQGKTLLPGATQFYRDNRALMDTGAIVPWADRREPQELSALQNAYNLKLDNPTTFDAEYQNNPQVSNTSIGLVRCPTSDEIVGRVGGYERLELPQAASHLYTAIDVQQDVLFWLQVAMSVDFTGWIIDYGAYPEQPLGTYWTLSELQVSLRQHTGLADVQGAWFAGLNTLLKQLYEREYQRDDGALLSIDKTMIDANYGDSSKSVYAVCRQSPYRPVPFHGKGITAKQQPLAMRKSKPGERAGEEWFLANPRGTKTPRHVVADTNLVKTMLARRFMVPLGVGGAWSLYQAPVAAHRMLADQLCAEYPIETEGRGRKLLEWSLLPGRDNHYLDCSVMVAVLALMSGCMPNKDKLSKSKSPAASRKKTLAQMREEALRRRDP